MSIVEVNGARPHGTGPLSRFTGHCQSNLAREAGRLGDLATYRVFETTARRPLAVRLSGTLNTLNAEQHRESGFQELVAAVKDELGI